MIVYIIDIIIIIVIFLIITCIVKNRDHDENEKNIIAQLNKK